MHFVHALKHLLSLFVGLLSCSTEDHSPHDGEASASAATRCKPSQMFDVIGLVTLFYSSFFSSFFPLFFLFFLACLFIVSMEIGRCSRRCCQAAGGRSGIIAVCNAAGRCVLLSDADEYTHKHTHHTTCTHTTHHTTCTHTTHRTTYKHTTHARTEILEPHSQGH